MTDANPRAVLGDNQPPLSERLGLDHSTLMVEAKGAAALVPATIRAIQSDEEAAAYTETAKDIKKVLKLAEVAFKAEKQPWLDGGRVVDGFFQSISGPMAESVKRVVDALNAWQRFLIAAKNKAAAEAAEKARREAAAFDEPAPAPVAPVAVKEAARVVSFSGARATASTKWKGEVTDIDALPRQYMMRNQAAIDAAIAGGVRQIPGVNIYEDVRTAIR